MIVTHEYRIYPSAEQITIMERWLELLRRHWNYALGQRLDWLSQTREAINTCSIIAEPIGEIPEPVTYYSQQSALKETKVLFPEYRDIYAEVQQGNLRRLDKAWQRWWKPDITGKRAGRPRFKKVGKLRSFTFPRINCAKAGVQVKGERIRCSRIGEMRIRLHRPFPDGFTPKTCTVLKKADGWYVAITLKDASIPELLPINEIETAVGVDVGLKEFAVTSTGETFPIQQFYRRAQAQLARAQRKLARKQKRSRNYLKQLNRVQRLHQRIERQRQEHHYRVAHVLVQRFDLIALEDLNIRGLAKTRLAKSILDAGWGGFMSIVEAVAVKRGLHMVKVSPHGTSQDCSGCGAKVPKTLSVRTHQCPHCGLEMDRDENAAINILNRALCEVGIILPACGGFDVSRPVKQEAQATTGVQLSLFV
ncbi:RNA-guided endonuclease InsQ/TnpB family protein [Spirulina sp.]|uniref:RNA-guided endonuclease InsQ/TnpB family protein n=1 Tax=Spirulina sp. TaxID=1157 RepID=UPI003F72B9D3